MVSGPQRHGRALMMLFLLLYGCVAAVNGQNSTCCAEPETGLKTADVAAIILGVVLFTLLVITGVICYKQVCVKKEPEQSRVSPGIVGGFSTSPEQLKYQTDSAIEMEKRKRQRQQGELKLPIIYMYDDIYHAPKSRPLPSDSVIPNGYPAASQVVRSPRRTRNQSTEKTKKKPGTPKSRSTDHGEGLSQSTSRTVSLNGHIIYPDCEQVNFTTHYEVSEPYRY